MGDSTFREGRWCDQFENAPSVREGAVAFCFKAPSVREGAFAFFDSTFREGRCCGKFARAPSVREGARQDTIREGRYRKTEKQSSYIVNYLWFKLAVAAN